MITSILLTFLSMALCISVVINYYSFKFVFERLIAISNLVMAISECNEKYISKTEKLKGKND